MKIIVLGAGLVGKVMAADLAKTYAVTSADINENVREELEAHGAQFLPLDFTDKEALIRAVQPYDLVIGAVPGFMGYQTAEAIIEAGKNMVDISFFPEDPFALHEAAVKNGVTIVTDCGVAPGMSNIILGRQDQLMKVHAYQCYVGGLPLVREWPFEYRSVFSPVDVIEEYVRPARYVQNGAMVTREALSDPELLAFDDIGTLEAWNSDGLRSLIHTMPHIPNMIEKTLRYPGCVEYLRMLRTAGFFDTQTVEVNGAHVRPVDVTARLLFPKWKLKPGEKEFTVMRIQVDGEKEGKPVSVTYHLADHTDAQGVSSMARTTGYTCTAAAQLLISGAFTQKGICPPEYLGREEAHYQAIVDYLEARGVHYRLESKENSVGSR